MPWWRSHRVHKTCSEKVRLYDPRNPKVRTVGSHGIYRGLAAGASQGEHHWSYSGDTGPHNGRHRKPIYSACGIGKMRRPSISATASPKRTPCLPSRSITNRRCSRSSITGIPSRWITHRAVSSPCKANVTSSFSFISTSPAKKRSTARVPTWWPTSCTRR